jgi:hypothetical protein
MSYPGKEANQKDLSEFDEKLEKAKQSNSDRAEKTDDLTTRFRELRKRNHFRLMLEEIFHD